MFEVFIEPDCGSPKFQCQDVMGSPKVSEVSWNTVILFMQTGPFVKNVSGVGWIKTRCMAESVNCTVFTRAWMISVTGYVPALL
jgi:hypothetical protein